MTDLVTDLFAWDEGVLLRRKVTQCALSRVCGGCGTPLGRPIAFVGSADEVARNEFHAPPLHATCADDVRRALEPSWEVVLTSGFEFVRPASDDLDPLARFQPNSLIG
ncbi:hypothetical protein [Nocardioides sp.]|uniref:hypothetical protein n=1 Tax=Nocardioides sp. TaxID=35761 RepID=UPI002715F3D1|nr:hypothetical protein [Nocardioides sp.]MDO9457068.1 hypothetical protein [Nocardioides sp.]